MHSAESRTAPQPGAAAQVRPLPSSSQRYSPRTSQRSALLVTLDSELRTRLAQQLRSLRWQVREAAGGAEMFAAVEEQVPGTILVDSWLPDLEVSECVLALAALCPEADILSMDGASLGVCAARGVHRGEVLHALRYVQGSGTEIVGAQDALLAGPLLTEETRAEVAASPHDELRSPCQVKVVDTVAEAESSLATAGEPESAPDGWRCAPESKHLASSMAPRKHAADANSTSLPEFIGADPALQEVSRRISLVARRKTTVLVHGPTGTGKELVARALHRLSGRPDARFVAINCAAIPEALVEAELFGHARGAFTGAVQGRVGRIEAAAGGTLFLDEVGELPLSVQGKLLRFLESGEVQRVGDNQRIHVDARVVAATHRKLGAMAAEGTFRLDLLHRLSVFLIATPGLAGRSDDIDALVENALRTFAEEDAGKEFSPEAREKLRAHSWPGNVRELEHTVERAWILAGTSAVIEASCVEFGESLL